MARPLKTFTDQEARDILNTLLRRSASPAFESDLRTPSEHEDPRPLRARLERTRQAAVDQLHEIERGSLAHDTATALRAWIDAFLKPEGWTRVRAAMRQRMSTVNNRPAVAKITPTASRNFDELAKAAGVTKKDYLCVLSAWMLNEQRGIAAATAFAATLPKNTTS